MSRYENHGESSKRIRRKQPVSRPSLVLIICLLLVVPSLYQIKPVFAQTIHVPDNYGTIQEAVDNAADGYIIRVAPDIYYEHVVVPYSVTIVGENPETTIVDGTSNGTVFTLEAPNIQLTGFTIRNAGPNRAAIISERMETAQSDYHVIANNIITGSQSAVRLSLSDRNTIANNTISENLYGVLMGDASRTTIFNNTLTNNSVTGIYLNMGANNNDITENTITNSDYGLRIESSVSNVIEGNSISQTSNAVFLIASSTDNTIRHNRISGQTAGVYSSSDGIIVDHNTFIEGAYGIYLYSSTLGSISYNTFSNSSVGIRVYNPSLTQTSHTIRNNKIVKNMHAAIELVNAEGNTFTGNWLQQNTYGVYMSNSMLNDFYHNNFVHNAIQAYSGLLTNAWDNGAEGNYWSDYTGEDPDGNGIGNTAYRIFPIGWDNFPLMHTWSEHDIEIQNVTPSTNEISPGEIVDIAVTVINRANTSVSETFTVIAKYNLTVIETQPVTDLAQGAIQTLTFHWNTTGVERGNYTISAEASIVPDELNTDNNTFIDGAIKVVAPILGDINRDGTVSTDDLEMLNQAFGSISGNPDWNPEADLNADDVINILDLYVLGKAYGQHN